MVTDHLCRISWRSPPRSFVSLMTLYESNYIRLGWLIPDLQALGGQQVSHVRDDVSLYLDVVERSPYTSVFNLSYRLGDDSRDGTVQGAGACAVAVPDMQIRIYHDARLAEARSCADNPPHPALGRWQQSLRGELDRRWARNMLLNKWLEYCAERGHRFGVGERN